MRYDVNLYLDGEITTDRIGQLIGPFNLFKKAASEFGGEVRMRANGQIGVLLDRFFVYKDLSQRISLLPFHMEAQKELGFNGNGLSLIHYYKSSLTPDKVRAFEKIMLEITSKGIPLYSTYKPDGKEEFIVSGFNPSNWKAIRTPIIPII